MHANATPGQSAVVEFTPTVAGSYQVVCTLPGHKEAGMVGQLMVAQASGSSR